METTFISIHDLSENATILYSSDSVIDILGYTPDEIVHRSVWDFFPPEELPFARSFHQKRVFMDKAAVLAYCRIRDKQGQWVGCECCFTVVYDVMVVCTSIYKQGFKSERRAVDAPMVRRIFSTSPKDPRYHMLSHLSAKFSQPAKLQLHEPRAALFLNRFTRTLTIMYATSGLQDVIGIPSDTMRGRSFYYCISENCLQDAVKCLENAKSNDSIAYLRFCFRDPRIDDYAYSSGDSDEEMTTTDASEDREDGGVHLRGRNLHSTPSDTSSHAVQSASSMEVDSDNPRLTSRNSSGDSTRGTDTHEAIFGQSRRTDSSATSLGASPEYDRASSVSSSGAQVELEAVISCTSDGLVVCLRKARPMIPNPSHRPARPTFSNGLFAAPWATEPILPSIAARSGPGSGSSFAPSLGPQGARHKATQANTGGSDPQDFMNAIRDQAIFAWALVGINGSLTEYGHGQARGESLPQDGVPIWESDTGSSSDDRDRGSSSNHASSRGNFSHSPSDDARSDKHHKLLGDQGSSNSGSRSLGGDSHTDSAGGTPFFG